MLLEKYDFLSLPIFHFREALRCTLIYYSHLEISDLLKDLFIQLL